MPARDGNFRWPSAVNNFSSAERPGTSKRSLVRPMRLLAVTAAEGLDVRGRRLANREEVEGACASQSGEGLLNKDKLTTSILYPVLRRAAAASQELLQRREVACVLFRVPARENVAPMRRRRREGGSAQTTARRATVSALASTATRAHGRGRPLQRRAAPATGRARSHGGFVDSRAVRRRKRVLWRPRKARGSRGWGRRARNVSKKLTCCRQPRSRGRRLQGELSRTFLCESCGLFKA